MNGMSVGTGPRKGKGTLLTFKGSDANTEHILELLNFKGNVFYEGSKINVFLIVLQRLRDRECFNTIKSTPFEEVSRQAFSNHQASSYFLL